MRSPAVAVVLLLVLTPALLTAQSRGGRGGGRRGGDQPATMAAPTPSAGRMPSTRDLEKANPLAHLLDKRRDLALTDAQVEGVKTLQAELAPSMDSLLARYDSLMKVPGARSSFASLSDEQRQQMMGQRIAVADVTDGLQAAYEAAGARALGLLDEGAQREKGAELLARHRRETMGSLGGGRGGRGAGGAPPAPAR